MLSTFAKASPHGMHRPASDLPPSSARVVPPVGGQDAELGVVNQLKLVLRARGNRFIFRKIRGSWEYLAGRALLEIQF